MKNNHNFSIKSTIQLNFKNSHLCEISYKAFLPEFNQKKLKRSKISIEKKDEFLIFEIESNDITAFRATINEILSFGKIIDNTLKIVNIP